MERLTFDGRVGDSPEDLAECLRLLQEQVREMECLRGEVAALQLQIEQQLQSCRRDTSRTSTSADVLRQRAALRAVWQQVSADPLRRPSSQRWFSWWPVHVEHGNTSE